MESKNYQKEFEKAEIEIEEMAMQIADMLGVALYYAGVTKENLPKAVDLYLKGLDEVFDEEDEEGEMGFEEIIQVIEHLKVHHPKLFGH